MIRRQINGNDHVSCSYVYRLVDKIDGINYCAVPPPERDQPLQIVECSLIGNQFPFCFGSEANWLRTSATGGWCSAFKGDVINMVRCNPDGNYPSWKRILNRAWYNPSLTVEPLQTKDGICPYADLSAKVWKVRKCDDGQ